MEITLPNTSEERIKETASERRLSTNLETLLAAEEGKDKGPLIREKLRHQFKIIDYGLANFDETFAAGPDVVVDVSLRSDKDISANHIVTLFRAFHSFLQAWLACRLLNLVPFICE